MLKKLLQYYQIFCNLSLDVVLGVICCMLPLPLVFNVQMPITWYVILPLCTWIIYLGDHVVDVTRHKEEYPSPRHRFVKKYLWPIVTLIVVTSLFIGWEVLHHFSKELFWVGCVLAGIVVIHLVIVNINPEKPLLINNKEMAIAFVYATGIYIGPLIELYFGHRRIGYALFAYVCFLGVTFINLLTTSIIEYRWDEQMKNSSWVRVLGIKESIQFLYFLIIATNLMCVIGLFLGSTTYGSLLTIYMLMASFHLFVYRFRSHLQTHLLYRKGAEALFWLPALLWLFAS